MQYCQVFTSVEQTAQALRVLDVPIAKQRAFAGPIVERSARLLWNFRESDVPECMHEPKLYTLGQDYNCIISYTRNDLKEKLVAVVAWFPPCRWRATSHCAAPIAPNAKLANAADPYF